MPAPTQTPTQTDAAQVASPPTVSKGRANYTLFVLTLIWAINFFDRNLLNALLQPIKNLLQLSDTTLGLITGFGFVLLFSISGLTLARLADKFNRVYIVSVGLAVWSALTSLTGQAGSAAQLALARSLVGVSESVAGPATFSVLADCYPPEKRGRSMSFLSVATFVGASLAFIIGSALNQRYGWRNAFFIAGLPGLAIALLLTAPAFLLIYLPTQKNTVFAGIAASAALSAFQVGPISAAIQGAVKVRMRAFASAIFFALGNLLGQGFGPLIVGAVSDALQPAYGDLSLRYGLLVIAVVAVVGGLLLFLGARHLLGDMERCASVSEGGA